MERPLHQVGAASTDGGRINGLPLMPLSSSF
jgi:hypothetical protein